MSTLVVTHLNHDLQNRRSYVNFVWSDDPAKRLGLEVPYGTTLDDAERAANIAVQSLSDELVAATIELPQQKG
ncbi:hypothetical protein PSC71_05005 [Devosia sp. J2-20]|jgi:hypothetical protein|uniref:hypothetical protein n=1 Tax=Devosia sp. J2-20 TaxID=3026161 RepID=UPI00249B68AA|nr:hypothetical protein [Devosia sp. J2-20]WDR00145.1 hypothetical protein PSC71_05005 [Devosia sp. J2-20]|tara:strand:- start:3206 stop:3424 length:219 start_codon:yes stop_codon:yes gene_type:complete